MISAAILTYGAWMLRRHFSDPGLVLLTNVAAAKWITFDEPVQVQVHGGGNTVRAFRIRFKVVYPTANATLRLRALKRWNVLLDGKVIGGTGSDPLRWKTEHEVELAPLLVPGDHELKVYVQNENGPVALRATCDALSLSTDERWESTRDETTWTPARLASTRAPTAISRKFEPVHSAFTDKLPRFGSIFALVFAATVSWSKLNARRRSAISPAAVRWTIMGVWVLLGANNILRLPAPAGFDVSGHLEYISYLITHKRVPLATDGWQLFQAPLYYAVAAPIYLLLAKLATATNALLLLRALSLLAGLLQIEICYRATRHVFPGRKDLQILGTLFAGFLPMNIYLSQYVGNEPLASCLASLVILLCLKQLGSGDSAAPAGHRTHVTLGIVFGLALLTKFSAIVLTAPLLLWFALQLFTSPGRRRQVLIGGVTVFGVATLVAGWYYARNWIHLGRPFVGGWDLNRGIPWWQDPGYRTPGDLLRFGEVFTYPIYAGVVGFWDGVYATFWCDSFVSSAVDAAYAPPWNYSFLLGSVWLALIPTAAITLGAARALRPGDSSLAITPVGFALICVGAYWGALVHHFLTQPYYSAVKSFYTLGAMPAYTLLFVAGLDLLGRNTIARAIVYGGIAAWAVSVYLAYFAR